VHNLHAIRRTEDEPEERIHDVLNEGRDDLRDGTTEDETDGETDDALLTGPVMWGSFLAILINFVVIAAVVYFLVKGLGLDKMDAKK
jgi:hypothetical protein